jgi:hypothetical protein
MAKYESKNEIIANEWTTLRTLWDGCKASVSDDKVREEIEALFPTKPKWSSKPEDWYELNLAEQRVGAHLDATRLAIEYECLLNMAHERKASFLATYESKAKLFSMPVPEGVTLDYQRTIYLSLLQVLQSNFIETRFDGRLRRETARRLFGLGLAVILLALLLLFFYLIRLYWTPAEQQLAANGTAVGHQLFSKEPAFGLMLVAVFGILGAYFSRVLRFQSKFATIGFEEVMNLFLWKMLLLRLLYGMIGAVIFYLLLRSRLIGGSAFPDLSQISIGEHLVWKAGPDGVAVTKGSPPTFEPAGLTILAPTAELAKLLIWSFIAGFSERLVPDALERTEAQAKKSDG